MANIGQEGVGVVRRSLRRPASTAGIVLTLTLGIAISVSMFSVLHGVALRALPYPDGERIVVVFSDNLRQGVERAPLTVPEVEEGLALAPGFEFTASYYHEVDLYTFTAGDVPRILYGARVSPDYFSVLGMPAALGRTLIGADFSGSDEVAVLNHAAWMELTGGDPGVVGTTLPFEETSLQVVGVLPRAFAHPGPEAIVYRPWDPAYLARFGSFRSLPAIGRLAPEASPSLVDEGLQARLVAVSGADVADAGWRLRHVPLIDTLVGDVRKVLFTLFGIALMVLLVANSTVASLLSIRMARRNAEFALCRALGASNARVAMSVASELVFLAALAALCGVFVAHLMLETLAPLAARSLPRADEIGINGAPLMFSAAIAVGSAILGGAPALLQTLRADPADSLRWAARLREGGEAGCCPHSASGSRRSPCSRRWHWQRAWFISAKSIPSFESRTSPHWSSTELQESNPTSSWSALSKSCRRSPA